MGNELFPVWLSSEQSILFLWIYTYVSVTYVTKETYCLNYLRVGQKYIIVDNFKLLYAIFSTKSLYIEIKYPLPNILPWITISEMKVPLHFQKCKSDCYISVSISTSKSASVVSLQIVLSAIYVSIQGRKNVHTNKWDNTTSTGNEHINQIKQISAYINIHR